MRRLVGIVLASAACGVDPAVHAALEQRVELLARRLDAVETAQAKRIEPPPSPVVIPPAVAIEREPTDPRRAAPVVRIGIDRAGVTIDGSPIVAAELDAALGVHAARSGVTGVIIDAAPDIDHSQIVALIDRIKASGLHRVAIATRGGAPAPEPAEDPADDEPTAR